MGVYGRAIEDVSSDALVRFDQMLTGVSAIPTGQAHATLRIGPKG
jgi:hypothetical protein